jgi:predicted ATPase
VWRVRGESAVGSRFAAVRSERRVPFVGRAHEMGLLLDRWRLAASGEGQFVLLTGEAGIGKSRLIETFRDRCGDDLLFMALQCSAHHENTALYPMVRYLELSAGFACDDTAQQKLEKLQALLAPVGGGESRAAAARTHLLALLLSLPTADCPSEAGEAVAQMTPAQRRSATIAVFVEHVIATARRRPVLVLLEDAHWIDPSTIDLVGQLIDSIQSERVLLIVTARPDFGSPWTGRAHAAQITLSRLGRVQCAEMVAAVAAAHALSRELRDEIVAKTDGVPLFVEEVTKTILESAAPDRSAVPATLHDSLMARLDRLGDAKELAQVAAVIGRQFPESLLEAILPLDRARIEGLLARLVEGEIVFPQRQALETSYIFKHALMRDIAYDSLLRARRQTLHERIARALEERFPATAENEPELLAYHYAAAGQPDAAARAHERAADRALARSAYAEAEAHLTAALGLTRKLPDHARRELALLLKLYPALSITKGIPASSTLETAQRSYDIAQTVGDSPELFRATWNLWFTFNLTRRRDEAQARAEELVALGQRLSDADLFLEAIHCRWSTALFRGDLAAALTDSLEGERRYDPARHHELGAAFGGHDPGVCAYCVHGLALAAASEAERAREAMGRSIALAEDLRHPHSLAHAYMNAMIMHQILDDVPATAATAQRLVDVAEKWNFAIPRTIGRLFQAWSTALTSDLEQGLHLMETEFKPAFTSGPMPNLFATMLAGIYLRANRTDEARTLVDQTLQAMRGPDPGFYLPELVRIRERCGGTSANGAKAAEMDGIIRRYEQRLAALKAAIAV